jgi:hypothetical protein
MLQLVLGRGSDRNAAQMTHSKHAMRRRGRTRQPCVPYRSVFQMCPNVHLRLIPCLWILTYLLPYAVCAPVDDECWNCLAERSSRFLASDPVIKSLNTGSPHEISAGLTLLSARIFDHATIEPHSNCRDVCGERLQPLLLGEYFEVSARAIMKCALRSLNEPAVAYVLRAHSLRLMLAALRMRKPFIRPQTHRGFYRDAFVYLGPPHEMDLRGKRGAGNWAEFKLSLQVVLPSHSCLPPLFHGDAIIAAFEVLLAFCSPCFVGHSARRIQRYCEERVAKCR